METAWISLERNAEHKFNWKVRQINGVEIPEWRKGPSYPTLEAFCEEQVKRGRWKSAAVDHGESDATITFWR